MALLYRAIWSDDREDLLGAAAGTSLQWLINKGLDLSALPENGEIEGEWTHPKYQTTTRYRLSAHQASKDGVDAFRLVLDENRVDEGENWTTILTALEEPGVPGTLWVDVERHSSDPFSYVAFRAPLLVLTLIQDGQDPRVGHVRLEPGAKVIPVEGLAGLIKNDERRLPVVVFSHDPFSGTEATLERADLAYRHLAGVAQVFVLRDHDVTTFRQLMGDDLAVWGGGARLYLPNTGYGGLRPQRHRYVSRQRAVRSRSAAAETFVSLLSATVPATLAPLAYGRVRMALLGVDADEQELLALALEENQHLGEQNQQLRTSVELANDACDDMALEYEALSDELSRAKAHLDRVLRGLGLVRRGEEEPELPDSVEAISEALDVAGRLPHLEIHPDAPVDIDKLETAVTAGAWASTLWRALRALDAYASEPADRRRGFWNWCEAGESAWTWPATPKRLAMSESESVRNTRGARMLPVSTAVDPSGRIEMLAHMKIAEGGGPLAPRVYFHDDTSGPTGKVHVGFVGPHEHMPNKSTN